MNIKQQCVWLCCSIFVFSKTDIWIRGQSGRASDTHLRQNAFNQGRQQPTGSSKNCCIASLWWWHWCGARKNFPAKGFGSCGWCVYVLDEHAKCKGMPLHSVRLPLWNPWNTQNGTDLDLLVGVCIFVFNLVPLLASTRFWIPVTEGLVELMKDELLTFNRFFTLSQSSSSKWMVVVNSPSPCLTSSTD